MHNEDDDKIEEEAVLGSGFHIEGEDELENDDPEDDFGDEELDDEKEGF